MTELRHPWLTTLQRYAVVSQGLVRMVTVPVLRHLYALRLPERVVEHGLCGHLVANGLVEPDLWHPKKKSEDLISPAARICAACPVRQECLDHASSLEGTISGVWGGEFFRLNKPRGSSSGEVGVVSIDVTDATEVEPDRPEQVQLQVQLPHQDPSESRSGQQESLVK